MVAKINQRLDLSGSDLQHQGQRTWKEFEKISTGLPGYHQLKLTGCWYALDGGAEGRNLYTYFPFLFQDLFPELAEGQLHGLALMGLLFLYHILIDDTLMDEEQSNARLGVLVSNAYLLKALQTLDDLLGTRAIPWKDIFRLHGEYSRATLLEEANHKSLVNPYQKQDMLRILSGKSAMAKLIVTALCRLANRPELTQPLERSFDLFYVADQMFDDFRDWKKDLAAGRYTYLLTKVITTCDIKERLEGLDPAQKLDLVGKHFYFTGLARSYLSEVTAYWEQAKRALTGVPSHQWVTYLESLRLRVEGVRTEVVRNTRKLLLERARSKYTLAQIERKPEKTAVPESGRIISHPLKLTAASVSEAGRKAAAFLRKAHQPGIGFEDFVVFGETLPVWVSSYVGSSLLGWRGLERSRARASRDFLPALAAELVGREGARGWPANDNAPEDADTTAWLLNFLLALGGVDKQVLDKVARKLLMFRTRDGSFTTYLPGSVSAAFPAYSIGHVEVTAFAIEVLVRAGAVDDGIIRNAIDFVLGNREPDGLWQSYWWDGQMYTTCHCVRALMASGKTMGPIDRNRLVSAIVARQDDDGSWGAETQGKNRAFETALALRTLLSLDASLANAAPVEAGLVWLLSYQDIDGSSLSFPMMRVPDGGDYQPWRKTDWALDSLDGLNTIVRDQNRYFTTAAVLAAITDFLRTGSDRRVVLRDR
ncbi:MAG TPA: prenyltransferase/squalene oxidase repeat-containing protein [Blastocatellia bacterium]|nr:prenyltransferase/squalene oxidase repeat-containing protein [Blastocatellia bacterium]